jgi:hypothetical protein
MEYAYADRAVRPPVDEWVAAIGTPLDAMLRRWAPTMTTCSRSAHGTASSSSRTTTA